MVFVGNLRKGAINPSGKRFRVDRSSPLGNPFWMQSEFHRDSVCDQYDKWFLDKVVYASPWNKEASELDKKAFEYLLLILDAARSGDVVLMCWCSPNKRCHAETIAKWVTEKLEGGL